MLNEFLARGVIDIVGGKLSPPTAARKREAAQSIDRPMPDSLQTLLASAHGAYVGSINLYGDRMAGLMSRPEGREVKGDGRLDPLLEGFCDVPDVCGL